MCDFFVFVDVFLIDPEVKPQELVKFVKEISMKDEFLEEIRLKLEGKVTFFISYFRLALPGISFSEIEQAYLTLQTSLSARIFFKSNPKASSPIIFVRNLL